VKIELEMYLDCLDESTIMEKVSVVTKHAKQLGFRIGEIEIKTDKHEKEEREEEEEAKINDF
jgi:hypothetical protein